MLPKIVALRALAITPLLVLSLQASAQEVVPIPLPRGATIRYLALQPGGPQGGARPPAAAVVLLAGGNGILGLAPDGSITNGLSNNFLVRSRQLFADHNLYVAVLDAPSDHATPPGLTSAYRVGLEHAQDIGVVLANVRMRAGVPTWLVGTSSGALSVANTATRTLTSPRASPIGIVLTSSLTHKSLGCPVPVTDVLLQSIRLPTLIVSHRDDACACSPAVDANGLLAKLTNAPIKEVFIRAGGDPPLSGPCDARSPHGFFGIESTVVSDIASWIKSNSPPVIGPGAIPRRK